jgi:hypothetical protein
MECTIKAEELKTGLTGKIVPDVRRKAARD